MYIVLHITQIGETAAKETHDYSDINAAKEKHHALCAYDYNAAVLPTLDYFSCVIVDEHFNKVVPEEYYRKPVQPEPEPEPEEIQEEQTEE